ncbi:nuclear transport factor 2 family protein [Rhodococcus erythropolis]|uniref:nuclear transport factor 2 family protein n=1 Tax=Rhodococcus erythropolis TaxID=1833 RepID=UPI0024B6A9B6|nr:nuclear transport factor 2 family protein [Rhodococcus erythropolis]MDJ0015491.1 nuclear transport factor 2 family protein [Rhodococcus erythropolis]
MELIQDRATLREGLSMVSADFVGTEPAGVPYGGEYRGDTAFLDLLRAVGKHVSMRVHDLNVHDLDETVSRTGIQRALAEITADMVHLSTGETYPLRALEIYSVRDGQICGLEVFYNDSKSAGEFMLN